jgi:hypothetical protein
MFPFILVAKIVLLETRKYSLQFFVFFESMNKQMLAVFLGLILSLISFLGQAQDKPDLVQFSGVVVNGENLQPVPFASIMISNTNRGTVTDYYGYFSFVAQLGDTIEFGSVGYKTADYIIPDTLSSERYSLIQVLTIDTIILPEARIYPWPSPAQFKQAFLNLDIPADDLERARKNLAQAAMRERVQEMPMGPGANFKYQQNLYQSQLYYAGQAPPISLLNPVAWAQFISAWRNGDFKRNKGKR